MTPSSFYVNFKLIMDAFDNIKFSFYGLGIEVTCASPETLRNIQRDYSFFLNNDIPPEIFFVVHNESPDYSQLPTVKASFYTPRNICYKKDGVSFIDYFGKGLMIIDKNIHTVYSSDPHLRHEIVFLSIMSLAGQYFDSKNMHRVHSLGIEINNKAALILLPSGGGKTSLFLELVKEGHIKLISEDSPLIDPSGRVFPFPIRIGVTHENKPQGIPDKDLHLVYRMEFEPKYLIDVNFFKDKITTQPLGIGYILCGTRFLGNVSSIVPLSKYAAFKILIRDSVIGFGLYQGIEFLFQEGIWGLLKKSKVIFSRLNNAAKAVSKARTYSFVLGYDRSKNAETLLKFLHETI